MISYKIDGESYGGVTLTAANAVDLNAGTTGALAVDAASGCEPSHWYYHALATDDAVAVAISAAKTITITTDGSAITAGAEFVVSDVSVSRGTHAPLDGNRYNV